MPDNVKTSESPSASVAVSMPTLLDPASVTSNVIGFSSKTGGELVTGSSDGSFDTVTVTATSAEMLLSLAATTRSYSLSESASVGASKSGDSRKERYPSLSMENLTESDPESTYSN